MLVRKQELDDAERVAAARGLVDVKVANISGVPIDAIGIDLAAVVFGDETLAGQRITAPLSGPAISL